MKEQIIVRVPKWTNDKLRKIANKKGLSKNAIITNLICDYIEREESKIFNSKEYKYTEI